jgi:hypothetical protein
MKMTPSEPLKNEDSTRGLEMHCPRCDGLMVIITLEDMGSHTSRQSISGWRCLLCGEIIEPGIVTNRKSHQEPTHTRARPWYGISLSLKRKPITH